MKITKNILLAIATVIYTILYVTYKIIRKLLRLAFSYPKSFMVLLAISATTTLILLINSIALANDNPVSAPTPSGNANDFFVYLSNKSTQGIEYKRGGKFGTKIDCSGLLSRFAAGVGFITEADAIHKYNAQTWYKQGLTKDIKDIQRGDLLYRADLDKTWMEHVAVYIKTIDDNVIEIIDAHPNHGVSRRQITIDTNSATTIGEDGNTYRLFPTTNPIISNSSTRTKQYQGEFSATSYIPTSTGMNINNGGASGRHTASGLPLKDEYAGKVIACPKKYPLNTQFYVAGLGLVDCKDRGGLITMAGEINSRGNIAAYNHIDVFAGIDTPKIERSKHFTDVYY